MTGDLSVQSQYYFVDQCNKICLEGSSSFVGRVFKSLFGGRSYDLTKVVSHLKEVDSKELKIRVLKTFSKGYLSEELSKSLASAQSSEDYSKMARTIVGLDKAEMKSTVASLEVLQSKLTKGSYTSKGIKDILTKVKYLSRWNSLNIAMEYSADTPEGSPRIFDLDDIVTLGQSRLNFSIAGFQNSTADGRQTHVVKVDLDGKLKIKINGSFRNVSVLRDKAAFVWDASEGVYATVGIQDRRWNYLSPDGLVPVDRFYHHENVERMTSQDQEVNSELQVVEKLNAEEMATLLAASSPDRTSLENCVLQIVTHPRKAMNSEVAKHLNKEMPVHCGIRLVTADGQVYSTGFGSTNFEDQWSPDLRHYFSTINGQPTVMDYEEFRPHEGRVTTNVAISEDKKDAILEFLNKARKKSIRFSITKQNCMRLGLACLHKAGVSLDIQSTLADKILRAVPDLKLFPKLNTVAQPFFWVARSVKWLVNAVVPECVQNTFTYLVRGSVNLAIGGLIYCLGAGQSSPVNHDTHEVEELNGLERLVRSPWDFFNNHLYEIYDSTKMIQWQLGLQNTVVSPYEGAPSMNIVPRAHSQEMLETLRDTFDVVPCESHEAITRESSLEVA